MRFILWIVVLTAPCTSVALAGAPWHVWIRHRGCTDPTTEGWRRVKIRKGKIAEGPIQQDAVGQRAAWSIDDDGTPRAPVGLSYQKALTGRELSCLEEGRWKFTLCLRVLESLRRPNFSICGEVANSTARYLMRFTADTQGNTVVTLGLREPLVTTTAPGLGYHQYEFVFDPKKGKQGELSLLVDGGEKPAITGYPGEDWPGCSPRLVWGSNESASSGHGHYHSVEFAMDKPPAAEVVLPKSYLAVDNVCAWPNLTVLPDGTIVATIYSLPSHGGGEGDAQCWASEDQGKTWTLRGTPAAHEPHTCRMNLAAGLARNRDMLVLCSGWDKRDMAAPRHTRILKPLVSRSSDGAHTWDVAKEFPREESMSEFIPFGDIIQAKDGSLCVSAYAQTPGSKGFTYHSYFLRSLDDGRTWSRVSMIAEGHNETALLQLPDGKWLAAARVNHMDIYVSDDNGRTWVPRAHTAGAQHPGHFLRLADGRLLLSHGDRRGGVEGVGVRVSTDEGRTWSRHSMHVARTLHGDCGYPASVQLPDGRILTAYYAKETATHPRYHMAVVFWDMERMFDPVQ